VVTARAHIDRVLRFPAQASPDGGWLLVWRVFLSVEANGIQHPELYVDAQQLLDASGVMGPLQISQPGPVMAPWNAAVADGCIHSYVQAAYTALGPVTNVALVSSSMLVRPADFEFPLPPPATG
jgi:hypothetical protein